MNEKQTKLLWCGGGRALLINIVTLVAKNLVTTYFDSFPSIDFSSFN